MINNFLSAERQELNRTDFYIGFINPDYSGAFPGKMALLKKVREGSFMRVPGRKIYSARGYGDVNKRFVDVTESLANGELFTSREAQKIYKAKRRH